MQTATTKRCVLTIGSHWVFGTKRVCDVYDHVRKGILTLLTLQKAMLKKESEVINRRLRLEKVAGETVAKEVAAKAEAARAAAAARRYVLA